jgi:hypothetical protein
MIHRHCLLLALTAAGAVSTAGCAKGLSTSNQNRTENRTCMASKTSAADAVNCREVVEPYIRYDDPDAVVFNDLPVQLYFFPQTPPDNTAVLKPIQVKSVVSAQSGTCREAGVEGLLRLQRLARHYGANAVVNIRSTWDREQLGDEVYFGCKVTRGRYALVWEGTLAKTSNPGGEPAVGTASVPQTADAQDSADAENAEAAKIDAQVKTRLRKLEELYYQGLISREEYQDRRKHILDAL